MDVRRIRVSAGDCQVTAVLNDSATAELVWYALPIDGRAMTWGDEVYFRTAVKAEEEDPQDVVEMGEVGYWPPDQALCLFFGPTPTSQGNEIRPASPVNVLGLIEGDPAVLKQVADGTDIVVEHVH